MSGRNPILDDLQRQTLPAVPVSRVVDDTGSHVDPVWDPTWSADDRLRWHLGIVLLDSGIPAHELTLHAITTTDGVTSYGVGGPGWSMGAPIGIDNFGETWLFLTAFGKGWEQLRKATADRCEHLAHDHRMYPAYAISTEPVDLGKDFRVGFDDGYQNALEVIADELLNRCNCDHPYCLSAGRQP